jgi:hypothetical protein
VSFLHTNILEKLVIRGLEQHTVHLISYQYCKYWLGVDIGKSIDLGIGHPVDYSVIFISSSLSVHFVYLIVLCVSKIGCTRW